MDIIISFTEDAMQEAFVQALKNMGYAYSSSSHSVSFTFDTPTTYQPSLHNPIMPTINEANKKVVEIYRSFNLTNNDPNTIPEEVEVDIIKYFMKYRSHFHDILSIAINRLEDWTEVISGLLRKSKPMKDACIVEIVNNSEYVLEGKDYGIDDNGWPLHHPYGTYVVEPPRRVEPGSVSRFLLEDNPGPDGSGGWVVYDLVDPDGDRQEVKFSFRCPALEDNVVEISGGVGLMVSYESKSGDGEWYADGVPVNGHPLYARFVIVSVSE